MLRKNANTLLEGVLLLLIFEVQGDPQESNTVLQKPELIDDQDQIFDSVPTCEHKTFCEITPHYPTDMVRDALKKHPHLQFYVNSDEIDIPAQSEDWPEEEPLCVSTERVVFPKSGITKEQKWKYIVNHENFTQSVRIETCMEEDKPCKVIEGFAEGYVTKCRQKYIHRQLLAVGADGTINSESFRFPASCCCHIEFQGDKFLKTLDINN
ncbi:spaetzle domain-containing protein [Ptiloglossa arizonensis]|uniref:spaetzle domain-containing protein n=1 Tax=Ptiloglossa arizonensis TaxID=3350558 RepID=UPI003F9F40D6